MVCRSLDEGLIQVSKVCALQSKVENGTVEQSLNSKISNHIQTKNHN